MVRPRAICCVILCAYVAGDVRSERAQTFNVKEFGAVGDGKTKDTAAIEKAVAAVKAAGSGTIIFPSGGRFLTGPFNVTSHCTLFIDSGATLLGSADKSDWPVIPALPSYGQGKKGKKHGAGRRMSLIHGEHLSDVIVTGNNGTIDVQGSAWWDHKVHGDTPPHLFELMWSEDVELSYLTLTNSPFWTVHPVYVNGFYAHHLWIINPIHIENTDGIDPDSTRNVLIHDVYIRTGDDGIAIKSGWDEYGYQYAMPSENITIRDCNISTPCAAIAIGSEMSGGVRDVHISNCHLSNATAGIHIKSGPGRGGYVHDVSLDNVRMEYCFLGFYYDMDTGGHPENDPTHHLNISALPEYKRIAVRNVEGKGSQVVAKIIGLAPVPIVDVSFHSVHFDGGKYECGNMSGTYSDLQPAPTSCSGLIP